MLWWCFLSFIKIKWMKTVVGNVCCQHVRRPCSIHLRLSQPSTLFSAAIMFPLFIPEGILCKDKQSATTLTHLLLTLAKDLKLCVQSWSNEKVESMKHFLLIDNRERTWEGGENSLRYSEKWGYILWLWFVDQLNSKCLHHALSVIYNVIHINCNSLTCTKVASVILSGWWQFRLHDLTLFKTLKNND